LYVLILGLAGCGGGEELADLPETAPVSGVVTMDGKPLSYATVTFVPKGLTKGVECIGVTDEQGKYTLKQMRGAEGAPAGEYLVAISQFKKSDGSPFILDFSDGEPEAPINQGAVESLPLKYSSVLDSILNAQVTDAGGDFPFELESK